jgi:hypothetical protein
MIFLQRLKNEKNIKILFFFHFLNFVEKSIYSLHESRRRSGRFSIALILCKLNQIE